MPAPRVENVFSGCAGCELRSRFRGQPGRTAFKVPLEVKASLGFGGSGMRLEFILDTGADVTVLTKEAGADLGLGPEGRGKRSEVETRLKTLAGQEVDADCYDVEVELPGGSQTTICVAVPRDYLGGECLLSCRDLVEKYWMILSAECICFHPLGDGRDGRRRAPRLEVSGAKLLRRHRGAKTFRAVDVLEISSFGMVTSGLPEWEEGKEWSGRLEMRGRRFGMRVAERGLLGAGRCLLTVERPSARFLTAVELLYDDARRGVPDVRIVG